MVLLKNQKFLIAVFCLMIFALVGEAEATLLWDGTFHGNEKRTGRNSLQSDGQYDTYTCLAQADSFSVILASSLPGGRTGYAGKFKNGVPGAVPTDPYYCNSERHNLIVSKYRFFTKTGTEIWLGWSQYLYPPWIPSGPVGSGGVYIIGLKAEGSDPSLYGQGYGMTALSQYPTTWHFQVSVGNKQPNLDYYAEDMSGAWYDFMTHIKYASYGNTGLIELWRKGPGDSDYIKVASKYGYNNLAPISENKEAFFRLGQYGSGKSTNPQTVAMLNPKVGTTRADVEYGGTSTPNPTDAAPPTIYITCPTSSTYSSQTISVSGTASDNFGVSKVEVKAGSGAWRTASGTTSWSVFGIALASGANTVTARATDAAGNTKETSIQVTYSTAGQPSGTLIFDGRFKQTDHWIDQNHFSSAYGSGYNSCLLRSDSLQIISDNRFGYVGKFVSKPGDYCNSGSATSQGRFRTQLSMDNIAAGLGIGAGTKAEVWYGWSDKLDDSYTGGQDWIGFMELGSLGWWNSYQNGELGWMFQSLSDALNRNLQFLIKGVKTQILPGYEKNVWHDWMMHIKWSKTSDGFVEIYHKTEMKNDYQLIYSAYNIITKNNLDTAMTGNFGIYRGKLWTNTVNYYHTGFKVGTTRASVEYGSSGPLGTPPPTCTAPTTTPNPQPSITQLTLKPGWNQISSAVAAGIDLATIEQSCTVLQYKNQKLWSWNAQAQSWSNPAKVEPLKGYWIYVAYVCTVPLSGTPATFSSLQLYSGWNKVSAQGSLSAIEGTCAGHITGSWIWNWDKATEKWVHPTAMQLDKGYWIKVDQDCVMGG